MTLPNFFIIGAARSGTTSLSRYLSQHPDIFMCPVKEPNHFCASEDVGWSCGPGDEPNAVVSHEEFETLFSTQTKESAVGEATTQYMYFPETAGRIKATVPQAKIIAILRNPMKRAYANFIHLIRDGREDLSDFMEAIKAEDGRIKQKRASRWHYVQLGFYHRQLRPYFTEFSRDQIKIILHDDFAADSKRVLKELFQFLSVNPDYAVNDKQRFNVAAYPRSRVLNRALHRKEVRAWLKRVVPSPLFSYFKKAESWTFKSPPAMNAEAYRYLQDQYRDDICALQDLIQRDLSAWLV